MAAYATADEVKAAMPGVISGATYDTILGTLATRASELIDRLTGRDVGAYDAADVATARYFDGSGEDYQWIDECVEITTLEVKDSETDTTYDTWLTSDYITWPYWDSPIRKLIVDPTGDEVYFPSGLRTVKVTAKWGYSADPPAVVKQAVVIQAARWFKRGQQAFQDVSAAAEVGQLTYAQKLDPDIETMIWAAGLRRLAI